MKCHWTPSLAIFGLLLPLGASATSRAADEVEFNRDIRSILSNNCFMCHGPDSHQRKGKLRLDLGDDAFLKHDNGTPLVPGDLTHSEVIARITSSDPDEMMPPSKSEKKLTPAQIDLLKRWVAQGAKYQKHWAFIPPVRSALPEVRNTTWSRNAIDRFILAKLESQGLKPSPEADKVTLCRRLYFDLLGLPPTPVEVDGFVADNAPDAYEKLVDRLLANPHFGERMALDWLDAARYADTHGYHIDSGRDQTRWRQWVIDAFNQNEPFDRFTIEQLAGDLLPNATADQKIATAFVRNNMVNFEGGAIPEEYLTAYVMDRVNTTSTVWLGMTLNCCQCHDHKFDPFTQKNYYQFYAFFNSVPENGLDGANGNAGPLLATPTSAQQQQLAEIAAAMKPLWEKLAAPMPELDAEQLAWEERIASAAHTDWSVLEPTEMAAKGRGKFKSQPDKSIVITGNNPTTDTYTIVAPTTLKRVTAIRLEALPDDKLKGKGPGRSVNGNVVLTDVRLSAGVGTDPAAATARKFKSASADYSQDGFPVANAIDDNPHSGWAIYPEVGKTHAAVFELDEPIANTGELTFTITLAFNAQFAQHQLGHFRLSATDADSPGGADVIPPSVRKSLAIAPAQRTDAQRTEVQSFFRTSVSPATRKLSADLAKLMNQKTEIERAEPTTMVMSEMSKPRDSFILVRGQYDKHGDKVVPAVPESLGSLPDGTTNNRLGLAEWLVSPRQPLTSRVVVNRYWQSIFGTGIVKTVEDFGAQGEEPTHPELLDWLAVQFMQGDAKTAKWDVKAMIRLIVMSSTYRQSSKATPELVERDPENRMLARGARWRLSAEFIRDQALCVSGLLNDEIGGKSVSPYQPAGLWEELMSRSDGAKWTAQVYTQDHGKDLYRRTMYTFWKRTSPPPALATFDAPARETCTVRRSRTNTPLQALVLMNDPTYVEASRKLAERMMTDAGGTDDARITFAFRLATARKPSTAEIALLKQVHDHERAVYEKDATAAKKLLAVGESPRNEKLDQADLAAWTTVASVILNLDETITKG